MHSILQLHCLICCLLPATTQRSHTFMSLQAERDATTTTKTWKLWRSTRTNSSAAWRFSWQSCSGAGNIPVNITTSRLFLFVWLMSRMIMEFIIVFIGRDCDDNDQHNHHYNPPMSTVCHSVKFSQFFLFRLMSDSFSINSIFYVDCWGPLTHGLCDSLPLHLSPPQSTCPLSGLAPKNKNHELRIGFFTTFFPPLSLSLCGRLNLISISSTYYQLLFAKLRANHHILTRWSSEQLRLFTTGTSRKHRMIFSHISEKEKNKHTGDSALDSIAHYVYVR